MLASSEDDSQADRQVFSETFVSEDALPPALSVGQQLLAAREAKGMSASDVARMLKLSTSQVLALEEGDSSRLPVTVTRGFVRNYARLLKLDPEPLMQSLTELQQALAPQLEVPQGTNATLPEKGKTARRDYAAVFSGLALVLVALAAYFFFPQDLLQSKLLELVIGSKPPAAEPEKVEAKAADPVPAPAPEQPAVVQPANAPVVAPEKSAEAPPVQQPAAAGALKLSFAQPSWVEIRDRSGEVVFSQLNPAGSQRDIEGQPPFSLVIGNATHVTVQYKGQVVELTQRSKDDVARLNLD